MSEEKLRVGMIAFTNASPFRLVPPSFAVDWVLGDPAFLSRQMMEGALDACLLPIGAMQQLHGRVVPLGPYGIACRGHVLSLRLFSRVPLAELLGPDRSVFITPRTTTTRLLVQELFEMEYQRKPRITEDFDRADARLLIGDDAMDLSREEFRWPVAKDISEWWFEQTGLGLVFAQWVVASGISQKSVDALHAWLEENVRYSETPAGRDALRSAGIKAGWSAEMAELYFDRLDFRLEEFHLQGMDMFFSRLEGVRCAD